MELATHMAFADHVCSAVDGVMSEDSGRYSHEKHRQGNCWTARRSLKSNELQLSGQESELEWQIV